MKITPIVLPVILAMSLMACNKDNNQGTTKAVVDLESTQVSTTDSTTQSAELIKVSGTGFISRADMRRLFPNEQLVRLLSIDFLNNAGKLAILKDRSGEGVHSLHWVSKSSNGVVSSNFIRRFFPEGGAPEFPLIFSMNVDRDPGKELVVLSRWRISHRALNTNAYLYQPMVFDNRVDDLRGHVMTMNRINQALGDGYDGIIEGRKEIYPYKSQASLRGKIFSLIR